MTLINKESQKEDYSNVINTKELEREARKTLKFESNAFSKTLGPYGMNTILEDRNLQHRVTKDGFSVYGSMVIYNRIGRVISKLIQKVSGSLNETVGDGTTSAVIVGNELLRLKRLIKRYNIPPKLLSRLVEFVKDDAIKQIDEVYKYPLNYEIEKHREELEKFVNPETGEVIDSEERLNTLRKSDYYKIIKNLASISLNNDYKDGELVANIFTELNDPGNGFINVEVSTSADTHYDKDRGFEIYRGMLIPEMVTEPDGRTASHSNPLILLVKGTLMTEDIEPIGRVINFVIGELGRPLVIIAGGFSTAITETFRQSIIKYAEVNKRLMPLLCVEVDNESSYGSQQFLDVEANVGAQIITVGNGKSFPIEKSPELYLKYLGEAKKISCLHTARTRILEGKSSKSKVEFRISEIDKQLAQLKSEQHIDHYQEIFKLNKRKACLLNDMITLCIGGNTIEEKESRKDLFDDAVRGCKSAVRNGICRGGNTMVAKYCFDTLKDYNRIKELSLQFFDEYGYRDMISKSKMEKLIASVLKETMIAYTRVYAIILNNKFNNWRKSYSIAKNCVKNNQVYNLVSGCYEEWSETEFNPKYTKYTDSQIHKPICDNLVVNSAETDTQILSAATSILDLLMTSNQFIRLPQVAQMQKNM